MKFLADMGISSQTVFALKNLGHDAIHLHEQALDRLPDPEIIKKTLLRKGCIISVTDGQIRLRELPI